jgi:hypothetical protein
MPQFVSKPIVPQGGSFDVDTMSHGEPSLPPAFDWEGETLTVRMQRKMWRSFKDDRGDSYLKRHWFEFETTDGRIAVVYFDRGARRTEPRWWLYTIGAPTI